MAQLEVAHLRLSAATDRSASATELADVGISAVGGIEITQRTDVFDVWFDTGVALPTEERNKLLASRVVRM